MNFLENDTITFTIQRTFLLFKFRQPINALDTLRIKTIIIDEIVKLKASFRIYQQRYMM